MNTYAREIARYNLDIVRAMQMHRFLKKEERIFSFYLRKLGSFSLRRLILPFNMAICPEC